MPRHSAYCGIASAASVGDRCAAAYIAVAAFEEPETLAPETHIWTSEHLSWLETAGDLPRYRQFRSNET